MLTELKQETRWQRWRRIFRQAINGEEQDFTTGSIDRAIVLLSVPMILEMAMESLFAIVDAFFVAKIGTEAVATVGLTESVLTLIYSIAIGLSAAATAMVARRVGEGRRKAASVAGAQTLLIALALSLLIAVPGFFYAKDILLLMAKDPRVAETGAPFTRLMLTANLPILLLWMLNGIFRGAGDAATAMRALWLANGVNIVLDPLLIFGIGPFPEMGLLGAGVATTIGRSVGVGYQLWHLFGVGKVVRLYWRFMRPRWDIIRRLLVIGSGSTGQYLIASASWIFMIYILGQISTEVTAGYTIAIRIVIFSILPSWGLCNAAATLVGQNLGAGKPERAEASVWAAARYNFYFLGSLSLCFLLFAEPILGIFTQEPNVVAIGAECLRFVCAAYVFLAYGMMMEQAFNGAGDTYTPTLINLACYWVLQIPLAWTLAIGLGYGPRGVFSAVTAAETAVAIVAVLVFRRGAWKQQKI